MNVKFLPVGPKPRLLSEIEPNTFVKILSSRNIYLTTDVSPFKASDKPVILINPNNQKLGNSISIDATMEEHKDFEVLGELKITLP